MSVRWQQVPTASDVEAPLGELPAPRRPGWLRRWLWAPAVVATIGIYVTQRLVEDPSGELEMWLMLALLAGLMVTAVAALVRYRDDQRFAHESRSVEALRRDARATTGSVTVSERPVGDSVMLRGLLTYPRGDETAEDTWSLLVPDGADPGPRPHDPVAVWWAPGSDDVVARYHRGWADELRRRTG
ncbi:hypothetical protein GCM10023216_02490 [Isoptericola chiayiensis]|uniref:DUF3093 domain-containing protein n=1 Tax=Isoptericola chiayiensis TaxID=579446 RepID=A0ABP8XYX5_9MICO|nr:hypothetical protein [Isoptericola chiayiensis]NOW01068.1 hypothetical protein [Isoptericola chiayiensis]